MVTPVAMEPMLGYHPCSIGFLTSSREPAVGQCQAGAVLERRVTNTGYTARDGDAGQAALIERRFANAGHTL